MDNENVEIEKGAEEYESAVEYTGFGRYNIMLLLLGGGSIITLLVETMSMAYVLPAAQCDLNLTVANKSILSSVSFMGMVFSALLWGFLADLYGRRKVLVISISISCVFGMLSSIVPNFWMFTVCRFINGFFIGCPGSVTVAYIGEFHSDKYRAKVISWTGAFVAMSSLYLPGLSWLILSMDWAFYIPGLDIIMRPWRLLVIIYSLPTFVVALAFLWFPESPKFLWSIGKSEESLSILRDMYTCNTRKAKSMFPVTKFEANLKPDIIKGSLDNSKSVWLLVNTFCKSIWNQMVPLFKYPLLRNMMLTSALQFGIQTGSQGVFMWVPEIFNKIASYSEEYPLETVTVCKAYEYLNNSELINLTKITETEEITCTDAVNELVFLITLIFGSVYTLVFILLGFIVDIVGKKLLLVIIISITSTGGLLINSMQSMETIIMALGMYLMMGPCMNLVFSVQVDLFPTQHRAKAVAVSQIFGRIGAVSGSSIVGFLLGWHCPSVFYIFSGEYAVLILISLLLPIPLFIRKIKT